MSEECNSSCSTCGESCDSRTEPQSLKKDPHVLSRIGKVIGVVSGKGGVGKSMVTSLLAVELMKQGKRVGILDADITGPSIPKAFGVTGPLEGTDVGVYPVKTPGGIQVVSVNLMLENPYDPVLWRGPVIAGTVTQFWQEIVWKDVDVLLIDMPPGTGDVSLTVFQSIRVDGIVVVTTPQELVGMIVSKAVGMAELMHIPIIGLVENMSYFHCPDNGKDYEIFGTSHLKETADRHGLKVLGRIPIDPGLAEAVDRGAIEGAKIEGLASIAQALGEI